MPLRARAFDLSQDMGGSSGTLRHDEYNRAGSINSVNDRVGIERAGSYISRCDPALQPIAFERHDNGTRNCCILRGIAYENVRCTGTSAGRLLFAAAFCHVHPLMCLMLADAPGVYLSFPSIRRCSGRMSSLGHAD